MYHLHKQFEFKATKILSLQLGNRIIYKNNELFRFKIVQESQMIRSEILGSPVAGFDDILLCEYIDYI